MRAYFFPLFVIILLDDYLSFQINDLIRSEMGIFSSCCVLLNWRLSIGSGSILHSFCSLSPLSSRVTVRFSSRYLIFPPNRTEWTKKIWEKKVICLTWNLRHDYRRVDRSLQQNRSLPPSPFRPYMHLARSAQSSRERNRVWPREGHVVRVYNISIFIKAHCLLCFALPPASIPIIIIDPHRPRPRPRSRTTLEHCTTRGLELISFFSPYITIRLIVRGTFRRWH